MCISPSHLLPRCGVSFRSYIELSFIVPGITFEYSSCTPFLYIAMLGFLTSDWINAVFPILKAATLGLPEMIDLGGATVNLTSATGLNLFLWLHGGH